MRSRFKNLLNYALNCIQRYKVRTIVILVCLSIAASIFSSVAFMKDGIARESELSLKYAPDLTVQGIATGRQTSIDTRYIGIIRGIGGVSEVVPRIWGYGNVGNSLLVIVGLDLKNLTLTSQEAFPLESGTFLDAQRNGTLVIGKAVASLLGAKVGSILTILSESNKVRQYEVVGVFNSESSIYNADMILMNINDARIFFDVPEGKVTDINVYLSETDPANYVPLLDFVARDISGQPNVRVLTKDVLLKAQETTLGARSGFFSIVWYVILIAVAIVAFNQTVVVGHESKFEVGLLKALGFSTSDVIQVRLIESAVLGALAGSIGLSIGIILRCSAKRSSVKGFHAGLGGFVSEFLGAGVNQRSNNSAHIRYYDCAFAFRNGNPIVA